MAEFLYKLTTDGHLESWINYILAFVERNPLSLYFSLFVVSFTVYMIRKILFGG